MPYCYTDPVRRYATSTKEVKLPHQPDGHKHPRLRIIPWWVSLIALTIIISFIVFTTSTLLLIAGNNAQLKIEAIKVGLTVGAGAGGVGALLLALRRQWLSEVAHAHNEDVARASLHDATERRVTELYGQAVEQSGHTKAAVRLGGLYSLERLAQEHSEQRTPVIDVVCAYLRMPFNMSQEAYMRQMFQPKFDSPTDAPQDISEGNNSSVGIKQELQVRLAAQRLLGRHLAPESETNFWAVAHVDLSGAVLFDFDFKSCMLRDADFYGAKFGGRSVKFSGSNFVGNARFAYCEFFTNAWFDKVRFTGDAWFARSRFAGDAWFDSAIFEEVARFGGSQFEKNTSFINAQFNNIVSFRETTFNKMAKFNQTKFYKKVQFNRSKFQSAKFNNAEFYEDARFDDSEHQMMPEFTGATGNHSFIHKWPTGWCLDPHFSETGMWSIVQREC